MRFCTRTRQTPPWAGSRAIRASSPPATALATAPRACPQTSGDVGSGQHARVVHGRTASFCPPAVCLCWRLHRTASAPSAPPPTAAAGPAVRRPAQWRWLMANGYGVLASATTPFARPLLAITTLAHGLRGPHPDAVIGQTCRSGGAQATRSRGSVPIAASAAEQQSLVCRILPCGAARLRASPPQENATVVGRVVLSS